jgi:chemotaxis protein methyltransferase CheR
LAWPGFRRVHRQVCKRIGRRLAQLHLADVAAYRAFLLEKPAEWGVLESFCRISISRFFRDKPVFDRLGEDILPRLADRAVRDGRDRLLAWSAGCASGEEPYSLALLWHLGRAARYPGLGLSVVATDVDWRLLERARRGRYRPGSLREVPANWRRRAFQARNGEFELKEELRDCVEFAEQDIRCKTPPGLFDLILCRNLAFTYFDEVGRRATLARLVAALRPGGALVIGRKETLPEPCAVLAATATLGVYMKAANADSRGGAVRGVFGGGEVIEPIEIVAATVS